MVLVEWTKVVLNILFKEASLKGSSYYALSTLVLLPLAFMIFHRSVTQVCGYKGIKYSSPLLLQPSATSHWLSLSYLL
uniref:Uncharacterized protein n=1 Tax=Quercus lobata TaxID=97700 RepID=A0A7N2KZK2_QUELO